MTVYEDMVALARTAEMRRIEGLEKSSAITLRDADFEELIHTLSPFMIPLGDARPLGSSGEIEFMGLTIWREGQGAEAREIGGASGE